MKLQGPRLSLLSKATCAVPLCEEPSPCRGLRPHHGQQQRMLRPQCRAQHVTEAAGLRNVASNPTIAFDLRREPGAGKPARRDLWGRCRATGTSTRHPHRPRVRRGTPRGVRRSVDRGAHRPAIDPRKLDISGRRRGQNHGRQNGGRDNASACPSPAWSKTLSMCGSSLHGNREASGLAGGWTPPVRVGKTRSRSRRCTDPRSLIPL